MIVDRSGPRFGVAQQLDRAFRVAAPGHRHTERRGGLDLVVAGWGRALASDPNRLLGQALALREESVEGHEPGQRAKHLCPGRDGFPWHELDRPAGRLDGPGRV